MPRRPRILSSAHLYHIILRSVNQHLIFEEDADYRKFLYILDDCREKYHVDILAYCIMDNHIHLLVHSPLENLSGFFESLGSRFVRWYNSKYSRTGYLFHDRYHSVAIETQKSCLAVMAYIHNNPVRAMICRYPSDYPWSSCRAFFGEKNPLINLSFSYDFVGSKDILLQYFSEHTALFADTSGSLSEEELLSEGFSAPRHPVSDEKALQLLKDISGISSATEAGQIARPLRNQYIKELHRKQLTIKQIARIMDVSVSTVKRVCQEK